MKRRPTRTTRTDTHLPYTTHVRSRTGRRRRPQARLPLPGVQPRGQHAVLQVGRRGADPHRPRPQVLDRAAARAGAEHRVAEVVETDINRRGLTLVMSTHSGSGTGTSGV